MKMKYIRVYYSQGVSCYYFVEEAKDVKIIFNYALGGCNSCILLSVFWRNMLSPSILIMEYVGFREHWKEFISFHQITTQKIII
jgi:hypothetical protein